MKILYLSAHSILEFDELSLFTELGHECFSLGAYIEPQGNYSLPRPGILGMLSHPELEPFARKEKSKTNIAQELIDWADTIIIMHDPAVVVENWDRIKHKKVIWRTIGQSTPHVEEYLRRLRYDGLKIVRMSKMEENIIGQIGSDALIPFYKDSDEWKGYNGVEKRAINFTQSLKGRRVDCHYDSIMQILNNFPSLVYGSGNTDLAGFDGGELPYDLMKGALRDNRVFVYGGTWPSPYTLALQEAMMTGIPIIAIGPNLAENIGNEKIDYYELPFIIKNNENGFISDDINQLKAYVHELLEDHATAKRIGDEGRKTAIELWGKEKVRKLWKEFFDAI